MDFAEQMRQAVTDAIHAETAGMVRRISALETKLAAYEAAFESIAKMANALPITLADLIPRFWVRVRAPYSKPQSVLQAVKAMRVANPAMGLREAKEMCDNGGRVGPISRSAANALHLALTGIGYTCIIEDK